MKEQVAVIGCGNWGQNLVRNFCELLGPEQVVCCDTSDDVTSKMASMYPGVKVARNADSLWDDPSVLGVAIATPVFTHYPLAKRALLSGKHVFVEKPLTTDTREALELCELAESVQRVLMVDHLLLFHPAVEEIERRITVGDLGEIYGLYSRRTNLGIIRSEENALWSLGPHDIAVMIGLIGDSPVQVAAQGGAYVQSQANIYDFVFVTLDFPGGQIGHLHLSWLDPHRSREITVVGSREMAVFDDAVPHGKLRIHAIEVVTPSGGAPPNITDNGVETVPISAQEPLAIACQHFLKSFDSGHALRSTGKVGAEVVRILAAAQASLDAGGKPIQIDEPIKVD